MKMYIFSSNAANQIFYLLKCLISTSAKQQSTPRCVVGTLLLAACAGWVLEVLFIGTAIVGFSTSMQVASGALLFFYISTLNLPDAPKSANKKCETNSPFSPGYSWLASKVDLTGNGNSFIFLGTNLGWLIFPPIAGLVIFSGPGGVGVFLLAFGEKCPH